MRVLESGRILRICIYTHIRGGSATCWVALLGEERADGGRRGADANLPRRTWIHAGWLASVWGRLERMLTLMPVASVTRRNVRMLALISSTRARTTLCTDWRDDNR